MVHEPGTEHKRDSRGQSRLIEWHGSYCRYRSVWYTARCDKWNRRSAIGDHGVGGGAKPMSEPSKENGSLLEQVLQRTLADLAASGTWDAESLESLSSLLTISTTLSQNSLMAVLRSRDTEEKG